jgi:hypothetical protein
VAERETITIRSYAVCFDLERRLHKIDRWRVPVPYGIPLRSIGYAACALLVVLLAAKLPLIGQLLGVLPPPVRFVIVPVGISYLATQVKVDGRPAHATAVAWLRYKLAPGRLVAFRPAEEDSTVNFGEVAFAPDERAARYRRARIEGPCEVVLRYPAAAERKGRTLRIRQTSERPMYRGKQIALKPGQRLVVR